MEVFGRKIQKMSRQRNAEARLNYKRTKVFCRHCGKENILEPDIKEGVNFEHAFYERCKKMLCCYCGSLMVVNVELLINLGIAETTLPQGAQICGRCKWISLPLASYCFKCGNPFTVIKEGPAPSKISDQFSMKLDSILKVGETVLGRYHIIEAVQKHLSIDYIVFDRKERQLSRIKTINGSYSMKNLEGFLRFSDMWLNIPSHENVLKAYSIEKIGEKPHLFLEYVKGKDLRKIIEEERRLEVSRTIEVAIQICEGMKHLHNLGLVHRDLKPENIIIGDDGIVKITDFETMKVVTNCKMSRRRTRKKASDKNICGTPSHMSPEQFDGYAGNRSDIYSFGIVLYQMVTGNLTFIGRTVQEYEKFHKHEMDALTSSPFTTIILKCLEKRPKKRYQDFGELKIELQKIK